MSDPDYTHDLQAIEDLIRQSLSAMKTKGIAVAPGRYGVTYHDGTSQWHQNAPTVCLVGAVLLARQPRGKTTIFAWILDAEISRVASADITVALIAGYDNTQDTRDAIEAQPDCYTLGQQFRREWEAEQIDA